MPCSTRRSVGSRKRQVLSKHVDRRDAAAARADGGPRQPFLMNAVGIVWSRMRVFKKSDLM